MTTPYREAAKVDPARPMTADEATLAWLESRMDEVERIAEQMASDSSHLMVLVTELRQATRRALEK